MPSRRQFCRSSGVGASESRRAGSESVLNSIAVVLITLILSYFSLVLGELVPKRIAMKKTEEMALGMAGTLSFVSKAFAPLVALLTASTNGILRLLGIDPSDMTMK